MIPSSSPRVTPQRALPSTSTPRRGLMASDPERRWINGTNTKPTLTPLRPPRRGAQWCHMKQALSTQFDTSCSGNSSGTSNNYEASGLADTDSRNNDRNADSTGNEISSSALRTGCLMSRNLQPSTNENDNSPSPHLGGSVPINQDAIAATPSKENNNEWLANFGIDVALLRILDEQSGPARRAHNSQQNEIPSAAHVLPEDERSGSENCPQTSSSMAACAFSITTELSPSSTPPVRRRPLCNLSTPLESRIPRAPRTPRARNNVENVPTTREPDVQSDIASDHSNCASSSTVPDSSQTQIPYVSTASHFLAEPNATAKSTPKNNENSSNRPRQKRRSSVRGLSRELRKLQDGPSNPNEIAGSEVLLTPLRSSRKHRITKDTGTVMTPVRRSLRLSRRHDVDASILTDPPVASQTPPNPNGSGTQIMPSQD